MPGLVEDEEGVIPPFDILGKNIYPSPLLGAYVTPLTAVLMIHINARSLISAASQWLHEKYAHASEHPIHHESVPAMALQGLAHTASHPVPSNDFDNYDEDDDDGFVSDCNLFAEEESELFSQPSTLHVGISNNSKGFRNTRIDNISVSVPIDVSQPSEPSSMRTRRAPSPSDVVLTK